MESMASLEPIVKTNNAWRRCCSYLKMRYSYCLVTSRVAILCLVWLASLNFVDQTLWTPWLVLSQDYTKYILVSRIVCCLLYPFFAYLGERWTRYYVIMAGMYMMCLASMVMLLLSTCFETLTVLLSSHPNSITLFILNSTVYFVGSGIFYSNIVQFSLTQIEHQCMKEKATFCRWLTYLNFCSLYIAQMLFDEGFLVLKDDKQWYTAFSACALTTVGCIVISIFCKMCFIIEPPQSTDPLKLIYQVIGCGYRSSANKAENSKVVNNNSKTAAGNTCSSTCTDSPPPKMLDYAMKTYGGKFTIDQVENVKSFLNVLPILITFQMLIGIFQFLHYDGIYYLDCYLSMNFKSPLLFFYGFMFIAATILPIPIIQFIFNPLLPSFMSLVRRMWSLMTFFSFACLLMRLPVYLLKDLSRVFCITLFCINDGIAIFGSPLILFTLLEYLLAHAPPPMLGLLIGVWNIDFLNIARNLLIFFPLSSTAQIVMTTLPSIVFAFHIITTCRFRYYQRSNEYQLPDETASNEQSLKSSIGEILVEKIISFILTVTGLHRYLSSFYFFRIRRSGENQNNGFEKNSLTLKQPK